MPAVLNAANEVAVEAFVSRRISFTEISATVRRTMEQHHPVPHASLQQILEADLWARGEAARG
jgi:1-deoxy-D-xylulose-5-phosphate reductoisomerase